MKPKYLIQCLIMIFYLFYGAICLASSSPEGQWKTIDDVTKKPRAIVSITINNGTLYGKIVKIFPQPGDTGICHECKGELKNKPVLGMQILWGLKQKEEDKWVNGYILDPKNGTTYRCNIALTDNGNTMKVRGYVGVTLLGRTQHWYKLSS